MKAFSYLGRGKVVAFYRIEKALYDTKIWNVKVGHYFVIFGEMYRKSRNFRGLNFFLDYRTLAQFIHWLPFFACFACFYIIPKDISAQFLASRTIGQKEDLFEGENGESCTPV